MQDERLFQEFSSPCKALKLCFVCLGQQYRPRSDCSLIRIYKVCHSICIFWMHYSMVGSHCSHSRIITAIFRVSKFLGFLQYCCLPCLAVLHNWAAAWHQQKRPLHPVKTQVSLSINPVWSESLLCSQWPAKNPRFLHVDSEDSDQTGRMPRLIWVFTGRTRHFVSFFHTQL